ncbi:hypothetical protein, partial [Polaromonas sp. YR568]|uniref:hypothetical protein n=1 Tax=Polaromonas sp. YR568 TaxID=1855301 RepID=UPI0031382644
QKQNDNGKQQGKITHMPPIKTIIDLGEHVENLIWIGGLVCLLALIVWEYVKPPKAPGEKKRRRPF